MVSKKERKNTRMAHHAHRQAWPFHRHGRGARPQNGYSVRTRYVWHRTDGDATRCFDKACDGVATPKPSRPPRLAPGATSTHTSGSTRAEVALLGSESPESAPCTKQYFALIAVCQPNSCPFTGARSGHRRSDVPLHGTRQGVYADRQSEVVAKTAIASVVFGIEQTPPQCRVLMYCKGLALPKPGRLGSYGPNAQAVQRSQGGLFWRRYVE
jgi:hypothetical protein